MVAEPQGTVANRVRTTTRWAWGTLASFAILFVSSREAVTSAIGGSLGLALLPIVHGTTLGAALVCSVAAFKRTLDDPDKNGHGCVVAVAVLGLGGLIVGALPIAFALYFLWMWTHGHARY